jgi:hypothetical protein
MPFYEALRQFGASGLPLAMNMDPCLTGTTPAFNATMVRDRLSMFSFQVPRTVTCTGIGFFTDTIGTGYPGTMYNGAGLWSFNANGDAIFIIDSGATNGVPWATAGVQGWTWTTPQQLVPGNVYLMGSATCAPPPVLRPSCVASTARRSACRWVAPFFRAGGVALITAGREHR